MIFSKTQFLVFALLVISSVAAPGSRAQAMQERVNTHARPGYATMTIHVLGAVSDPGLWLVEQDTDLLELLTVARPSGLTSSPRGGRQNTVVQIYRTNSTNRTEIYSGKLEDVLRQPAGIPSLQDGDIVTVTSKPRVGFMTVATWAGSAASIALLAIRILAIADR